ncbi:MAG: DUF3574 domain-containing protein [Bacteroidota bacterium]|jgi:hypothetical protein
MKAFILLILIIFVANACTVFQGQKMTKTELFFGLSKPNGAIVSSADWQAFADTVIAKTFSEGSTIVDARGQWLGNDGKLVSESSKVLILVSKLTPERSKGIELVREKYKKYFKQESVLRLDGRVKVGF